ASIIPSLPPAAGALGRVEDEHRAHARVVEPGIDAEQPRQARTHAGLFEELSHRTALRRFAVLHETGGEAPFAGARLVTALHQQDATRTLEDHAGCRHGIAIMDV